MQTIWQSIWRSLALVVILTTVVVAASVQAATLTSGNDFLSTLQAGSQANHSLIFTTPTGAAEDSTITVSFDTNFDTSPIVEDDVDVSDDGADLTTASDCTGSEQASVSMASDVLTITICLGDGGAIAGGSEVEIEIGTSATASGTGSNRITNPSSAGTYFVSIGGTFGDSGSIALPIGSDDSISVTGTISSGSEDTGGGDTPGGGGDITAPTISNIVVSDVTGSSAIITWSTNELASTAVEYGLTTSLELGSVSDSGTRTAHSIDLSGLDEGQIYYFKVISVDTNGNRAESSTQSFETLDETAPVISDIEVIDITTDSARVTWTTDEPAESRISYDVTTSYRTTSVSTALVTEHSVLLTGLEEGTEYHFQVGATDASSNQSFSGDNIFTTESDEAPTNVSGLSIVEGDSELELSWSNPSDDDLAGVLVLLCEDGYPSGPDDADCTKVLDSLAESTTLSDLENDNIYYVGVFAYDEAGQFASGALGEGTPSASDEELPPDDTSTGEEVCGNDFCAETESADSCPVDCAVDTDPSLGEEVCGDAVCAETESADSCPVDCAEDDDPPTGEAVVCGDDVCSDTESALSCPADCEDDSEPTSLGAEDGELDDTAISYLVAADAIVLQPGDTGIIDVLPTSILSIEVSADELESDVENILLTIGSDTFIMSYDDELALYSADVTTPTRASTQLVTVEVTYESGGQAFVSSLLNVVSLGQVYQVVDGEEVSMSGVTLTLFELIDGELIAWDGSPYNQFNPVSSSTSGTFAWYVPNGTYVVQAQADGFDGNQSIELVVENSIVNPSILMMASFEEEPIEEPVTQEPEPSETDPEPESEPRAEVSVLDIVLDSAAIEVLQEGLSAVREIPGVEQAAEVSVPTLAVTAGASVVVLSIAFDFLPFLQYLFTAPVLFFWRRKRKSYGVVYNAISKTPVDLAVVRLFAVSKEDEAQGKRGRLVKSRVTDKGGRYFFLVSPGRYRIVVTKAGFDFPSEYLSGERTDGSFLDLYHGQVIEVSTHDAVITANIPMDPSQAEKFQAPKSVIWRKRLRLVQHGIAMLGVIAALVFAIIRPTFFSVGMIALQILVYLLARRLAKPHKPISWGIVYDKETGRPLSQVVARIFEPKYNKLLETQVTDAKGRYAFMLGPNEYYAVFQKSGFESKEIHPIDYSQQAGPQGFSEDVELHPEETEIPQQDS